MSNKREWPTFREKYPDRGVVGDRQNTHWYWEIAKKCKHKWQPVSMVFETQLLDERGGVRVRQPDLASGRCYVVCMKCCAHSYIITGWIGYYLGSPDILEAKAEADQ